VRGPFLLAVCPVNQVWLSFQAVLYHSSISKPAWTLQVEERSYIKVLMKKLAAGLKEMNLQLSNMYTMELSGYVPLIKVSEQKLSKEYFRP